MRSLGLDDPKHRKRKVTGRNNPEAGILAAIESVVSGTPPPTHLDISSDIATPSPDADDAKRRKSRYTQRFGIGGFVPRSQKIRRPTDDDDDSSKKRSARRKPKIKLLETFPPYLQDAFFGKELLQKAASDSEDEIPEPPKPDETPDVPVIVMRVDATEANRKMLIVKEIQEIERAVEAQQQRHVERPPDPPPVAQTDETADDDEALGDFFFIPTGELLDIDLDSIMGEELDALDTKKDDGIPQLDTLLGADEDERGVLDCLPSMDGDEVDDVLKEVLQDGQDFSIVATLTSSVATADFSPGATAGIASTAGSPLDVGFWARDT